ncbi:hypothetical protein MBLNU13_g01140t1 [Cladosporium sp. NU13]
MGNDNNQSEYTPRALLVVGGAFTCLFCTVGFLNSAGIFLEYYARDLLSNESPSTIAWIGAIAIFFLFAMSPGAGAMLDAFGPTVMVYAGSVGMVFCIMMISLGHSFWQFLLAQGVLLGVSMALSTWPMVALVGQYFKRSRAAATGIVVAGSSLGGIIWPIVIDRLLNNTSLGFPWTMRILGFTMIPLMIFSCAAAKSPSRTSTTLESGPQEEKKADGENKAAERRAAVKMLLKQPALQLTCLAMFMVYFGLFAPIFYLPSFAAEAGFSTTLAFYTASIVNGASFLGRILPGFVADRHGKFNCCIIATISTAYGFASGGVLSLQQACAAQLATLPTIGLAIGTVTGSTSLSAMANVPISGALAEKYGYLPLSVFSGVTVLVGGILLVLARILQDSRIKAIV